MKVRVAAVIMDAENILLVKHRRRGRAYWTLPGGGLMEGETVAECLRREVKEETGLDVELRNLLFVTDVVPQNDASDGHVVNLIFHAVVNGGELVPGHGGRIDETRDHVEFVPLASVPALNLYPPIALDIAEAFLVEFEGKAKYLGNLWREVKVAERTGGAHTE
jgi:ADP-ribose pyrophosphatase YjhB (NUDIX family)